MSNVRGASCVVAVSLLVLAGCAISPRSADELAAAPAADVNELKFVAAVPVKEAFRNVLAKARECWHQTTGFIITNQYFVEAEPFDEDAGFARVAVRFQGQIFTSVTLRPAGGATTAVARNIRVPAGLRHAMGLNDFPSLQAWAEGKPADCKDRMFF